MKFSVRGAGLKGFEGLRLPLSPTPLQFCFLHSGLLCVVRAHVGLLQRATPVRLGRRRSGFNLLGVGFRV